MITLIASTIGIVAIACSTLENIPHRIFYNPSESAPRGWYWLLSTQTYPVDTFAFAHLPAHAAALANERRYLPRNVPLLKRIGATSGYNVCESDGVVRINGTFAGRALWRDGEGRPLIPWRGCRTLLAGEYFLLSRHSDASFDSRYFGPVMDSALLGRAIPLWTR